MIKNDIHTYKQVCLASKRKKQLIYSFLFHKAKEKANF